METVIRKEVSMLPGQDLINGSPKFSPEINSKIRPKVSSSYI